MLTSKKREVSKTDNSQELQLLDKHYELMLRFEREEAAKNAVKLTRDVEQRCDKRFKKRLHKMEEKASLSEKLKLEVERHKDQKDKLEKEN